MTCHSTVPVPAMMHHSEEGRRRRKEAKEGGEGRKGAKEEATEIFDKLKNV